MQRRAASRGRLARARAAWRLDGSCRAEGCHPACADFPLAPARGLPVPAGSPATAGARLSVATAGFCRAPRPTRPLCSAWPLPCTRWGAAGNGRRSLLACLHCGGISIHMDGQSSASPQSRCAPGPGLAAALHHEACAPLAAVMLAALCHASTPGLRLAAPLTCRWLLHHVSVPAGSGDHGGAAELPQERRGVLQHAEVRQLRDRHAAAPRARRAQGSPAAPPS